MPFCLVLLGSKDHDRKYPVLQDLSIHFALWEKIFFLVGWSTQYYYMMSQSEQQEAEYFTEGTEFLVLRII